MRLISLLFWSCQFTDRKKFEHRVEKSATVNLNSLRWKNPNRRMAIHFKIGHSLILAIRWSAPVKFIWLFLWYLAKFNVGSFASDVSFSFDALQKVESRWEMSKAVKYVKNMQASGGTGLLEAIKASLKKFSKNTNVAKLLFLLTDGAPNNPWSWIHGEFEHDF